MQVIDQFAEPFREGFDPEKRSKPGTAASKSFLIQIYVFSVIRI